MRLTPKQPMLQKESFSYFMYFSKKNVQIYSFYNIYYISANLIIIIIPLCLNYSPTNAKVWNSSKLSSLPQKEIDKITYLKNESIQELQCTLLRNINLKKMTAQIWLIIKAVRIILERKILTASISMIISPYNNSCLFNKLWCKPKFRITLSLTVCFRMIFWTWHEQCML